MKKIYCLFFNVLLISTLYFIVYGAVAQLARAPALQAGGQEFDSPQLHHRLAIIKIIELIYKHIEKYIEEIR